MNENKRIFSYNQLVFNGNPMNKVVWFLFDLFSGFQMQILLKKY